VGIHVPLKGSNTGNCFLVEIIAMYGSN